MIIQFYEKPGCINNTKQKALLEQKGHIVFAHSLLTKVWLADELRLFFEGLPVEAWFNPSNPKIKSGELNPLDFDEEKALEAMIEEPLLIRRPLIFAEGEYACGFDNSLVQKLLNNEDVSHLQKCPNIAKDAKCD